MGDPGRPPPNAASVDPLALGRDAHARRAWADAYRWLSRADEAAALAVEDLERLAVAAYMSGRDDDYRQALDRAHHAYLDAGRCVEAARSAFWLGLSLAFRGETGPATGWFGRAHRLVEREGQACVEEGYLLLPVAEEDLGAGEGAAAHAVATDAAAIGDRFGDADLSACARHLQGRALIQQAQVEPGLALLDEVMVAVATRELSPVMTGLLYCSVIDACQQVYALARAREWTSALAEWCAGQPQLVAFTGVCLVHRAEIMRINGTWREAMEEARRAFAALTRGAGPQLQAAALYQQAELHRLRGELRAAEEAYRGVSRSGGEAQPGLALLRLAEGRTDVAAKAIRRVMGTPAEPLQRTRHLPAAVEILLAAGDLEEAREASRELGTIAASLGTSVLTAMAAQARGAVALAEGDARAALGALQQAFAGWQQLAAPYLAARVRELVGLACRALGDEESAALELEAARAAFERLGAKPDLARVASPAHVKYSTPPDGLTPRERQVLRLVAAGKTNKAIAAELFVSEKTVDRHVSNILGKLDVASRTAAAAWAFAHKLV